MAGRNLFADQQSNGRNLFAKGGLYGLATNTRDIRDASVSGDSSLSGQGTGGEGVSDASAGRDEGFPGSSFIEPAATLISGAIAEPLAGLGGIAKTITSGAEAGAKTVEAIREGLTYQPRTQEGQEGLQAVGETLEPVAEALKGAETFLGDETFEATGSPALAAAATTIPTVIMEVIGVAGAKGAVRGKRKISESKAIKKSIIESAPSIEEIKRVSNEVFKELDESGASIKKSTYRGLVDKIRSRTKKAGIDKGVTPDSFAALKRLESDLGSAKSLAEINILREVASGAKGAMKKNDQRIAGIMVDSIDEFLDDLSPSSIQSATVKASEIGPKYKVARELWGRARRSETLIDAMGRAKDSASGFQNGMVQEFRRIIKSKKESRFFSPRELDYMKKVSRGTTPVNVSKFIGRFGLTEGQTTSFIGASVGAYAGASVFGGPGAVIVPAIGQVSKMLAQRLTKSNAKFADTIVRAGKDAEKITSIYLKNTAKGKRSASELSELLLRPDIALDAAIDSSNVLLREAAEIAKGNRILSAVAATAASAGAIKETQEQQNVR